jgi:UDP-N-acetylglucosamine 2-epimerase (non-hydrolysing)
VKVLTVLGTRPEIVRLSLIVPRLDALCEHVLVSTGQNPEPELSSWFFAETGLRAPDVTLTMPGDGFAARIGRLLPAVADVLRTERPDRMVILGDTDSGLSAYVAARLGIPVVHLEAGNRCFYMSVPEEVNRRLIDGLSALLCPYTERSRDYLMAEGVPASRIVVTGNPIGEVLAQAAPRVDASDVLARLGVEPGSYALATAHRQETVDVPQRLAHLVAAVERVAARHGLKVLVSTHPRTRDRLRAAGIEPRDDPDAPVRWLAPFGLADFLRLERDAALVLTDSGTVQEEACLLGVPCVTLRRSTERPETVEVGANVLAGIEPDAVARATALALTRPRGWPVPEGYDRPSVSAVVASAVLGRWPDDGGM